MRVAAFIARLARAEPEGAFLRITADGGIEFVGPALLLTDEVRACVAQHKDAIVAWLRTPIDEQPVEDQRLFDYHPTSPPEWWDDDASPDGGRWYSARELWPNGFPAASQERSPLAQEDRGMPHATPEVLAAGTGRHDRDGAAREPAQSQGALW